MRRVAARVTAVSCRADGLFRGFQQIFRARCIFELGFMRVFTQGLLVLLTLPVLPAACRQRPLTPPEKAESYYGEWRGPDVLLRLTPGKPSERVGPRSWIGHPAQAVYKKGGSWPTYKECEFNGLDGNDIAMCEDSESPRQILKVDVPPHLDGKVWKMTVKGTVLERQ